MAINALVINLDQAKARWSFQQRQLNYLGIDYERLAATGIETLSNDTYEKWANDWQRKLRQTEVACFLSHYQAWQTVKQSNKPWLVLEDDALLSIKLPKVLDSLDTALQQNPRLFDHLSFETRGRKKLYSAKTWQVIDFPNDTISFHQLLLDKSGAAAYLLTPHGADVLLQTIEKTGAGLADALLCHNQALQSMQTVPALAIQMDMANHYELAITGELINNLSQSSISTISHHKPSANSLSDTLRFKRRRLLAQAERANKQITYRSTGIYQEIAPIQADFTYLNALT